MELCRLQFTEVDARSAVEAAKFQRVIIVRGVASSYKIPQLKELAVSSIDLKEILERKSFTNWGQKYNHQFRDTKLFTALMSKGIVNHLDTWHNSAIVWLLHWFHADSMPPTEVAALLRGRKLWMFASPGSKEAANL